MKTPFFYKLTYLCIIILLILFAVSWLQLRSNPLLNLNQSSIALSLDQSELSHLNSKFGYSSSIIHFDTSWSMSLKAILALSPLKPGIKYNVILSKPEGVSDWKGYPIVAYIAGPLFIDSWWFRFAVIALASFIIIGVFKTQEREIRRQVSVQNQLYELEMKALKAQMNPHFIYNSLNSIQSLVAANKITESIHFIGSFARLLRQVLDQSEINVISLDKELETMALYIQLEALRLDFKLQYKQEISDDIVTEFVKILPLILQPFIENALWHGLSQKVGTKELTVKINMKDSWLICQITDNGIGRLIAEEFKKNSKISHESKAVEISRKRLKNFNRDDTFPPIEFVDLYDSLGTCVGTSVVVRIKQNGLKNLYSGVIE